MSNPLSPALRRVVVLCCCAAAMSGTGLLLHGHPGAQIAWVVAMLAVIATACVQFVKLRREER